MNSDAAAPSSTACLIAGSIAFQSYDSRCRPLIANGAADWSRRFLEGCVRNPAALLRRMEQPWFRATVAIVERLTIPGMQLHYLVRKCYLEAISRSELAAGIRQVVVLGAGFDTLALRLAEEFPHALFVEVDHPATQRVKREALWDYGRKHPNLVLLEADLGGSDIEAILAGGKEYDPGSPTLFIAEGLLMYLREAEVIALLNGIHASGGPGSLLAFTFMEPMRSGRPGFANATWIADLWLSKHGEPFRWGIGREELPAFVSGLRFAVEDVTTPDILRRRYLVPQGLGGLPLALGDDICTARRVD